MQGITTSTITSFPSADAYSLYAFTGENCPGSSLRNLMSSLFMNFHLSEIAAHRHQADAASDCPAQSRRTPLPSPSLSPSLTLSCLVQLKNVIITLQLITTRWAMFLSLPLKEAQVRPSCCWLRTVGAHDVPNSSASPANAPLSPFASSAQS